MKIDMVNDVLIPNAAGTHQKAEETKNNRFGEILMETMATEASGSELSAKGTTLTAPVGGLYLDPVSIAGEAPLVDRTERLLDALDAYRGKLGDRRVALKEVAPLIGEIKKQSEDLTSQAEALPDSDPLREILNQTLIVSSLEVLKFNRGDYGAA
jgi:hypothetical protein